MSAGTDRRIARRQRVLFALVGAIIASLALWALYALERWRLGDELTRQASAQAAELDRQLDQLGLVPRLLAGDPRLVAALGSDRGQPADPGVVLAIDRAIDRANALLADVQQRSALAFVFLMDATGRTVAASNHATALSFVGANYGFRPYFQDAMQGGQASHFAVGATTGRPGYFVAVPIVIDRAAPIGVVVGKMELDDLVEAWRSREHDALVLDADGVVILSSDTDLLYVPRIDENLPVPRGWPDGRPYRVDDARRLQRVEQGDAWRLVTLGSHDDPIGDAGGPWIGGLHSLTTEPWTLLALKPRRQAIERAIAGAAALAAALTIAALGWRVLMQRRRIVRDAARSAAHLERLVDERTQELASAQRALIARSRFEMLGRMSAAINHEVNQPLASLRLNLASARALLTRDVPPLDEIGEIVIDSDRTTRRIARVIATLRSVAGTDAPLDDAVSLHALFEDTEMTVQRERPATAAALQVMSPERSAMARGNAILLQQALLNLVYNGLDAIGQAPSGCVRLQATTGRSDEREDSGEVWVIDVSDNGPGVPDAVRPALFEPFARAGEQGRGLGIGLALSREIAERHGGTLELCEGIGGDHRGCAGGTTFRLSLPAGHRP